MNQDQIAQDHAAKTREQMGRSHTLYEKGQPVTVLHPTTNNRVKGVVVSCSAGLHCSVVEVEIGGVRIRVAGDRVSKGAGA